MTATFVGCFEQGAAICMTGWGFLNTSNYINASENFVMQLSSNSVFLLTPIISTNKGFFLHQSSLI